MNKLIIPVIASVLILGVLGTAEDAFAPKKLFVGGLSWDTDAQSFVVTGEIQHGMATAGENAGFTLSIIISSPDNLWPPIEGTYQITSEIDLLELVPCESICEGIEGLVDVTVNAQILNPSGKPVAVAEPLTVNLDITSPGRTLEIFIHSFEGEPLPGATCLIGFNGNSIVIRDVVANAEGFVIIDVPTEATTLASIVCFSPPPPPEYCPRSVPPPLPPLSDGITSVDVTLVLQTGAGCPR